MKNMETDVSDPLLDSNGRNRESRISSSSDYGIGSNNKSNSFHTRSHSFSSSRTSSMQFSFREFPKSRFANSQISSSSSSSTGSGSSGFLGIGFRWRLPGIKGKQMRIIFHLTFWVFIFYVMNWWMISRIQENPTIHEEKKVNHTLKYKLNKISKGRRPGGVMYGRLLSLAAHALAEGDNNPEPKDLWAEPLVLASSWRPCSDLRNWELSKRNNGYILVTANGGMNQQRVAVCNAVAVARLLNATLVVPRFMYSNVWKDRSQFGDIYQEEHFINYLKDDIPIVTELPVELRSLNLEIIGSVVTDDDIMKEAKPRFFMKKILPILIKNRVVHFLGFGNRLAFDPIPSEVQKLRCRCNFHALQFVPKIQKVGALLVERMRQNTSRQVLMDSNLVGSFSTKSDANESYKFPSRSSRYLALHLRFEIDMVAHSLCDFGGGEAERKELDTFRSIHFPVLALLKKNGKLPSADALRSEGLCPLTPEETVLMLAALGFNRKSRIYLAGSSIYEGKKRMAALTSLYPNLVTKENLLSSSEIEPFIDHSSQLAALDFIACAAADMFAMTDPGSQFSSLVSGYRIYYGGGRFPTIRPNKRRLASIFLKNSTIEWKTFEVRIRKAIRQSKKILERPIARSIYRHPRCRQCMCKKDGGIK